MPEIDWDQELPAGWEQAADEGGRVYFINHETRQTTWLHPTTRKPVQPTQEPDLDLDAWVPVCAAAAGDQTCLSQARGGDGANGDNVSVLSFGSFTGGDDALEALDLFLASIKPDPT